MSLSTYNNAGNADDVKNYLKCSWSSLTVKRLQDSIEDEKKKQNRATVIALLERAIARKQSSKKVYKY